MYDRTGKPVVGRDTSHEPGHHHRFVESTYSEDDDKAWSSQEWRSDELMDDRMEKPVVCPQRGAQQFVIEDDETELDLSLGSRSFLDRVNDQVRKRQKRSSMNVTEDGDKHSVIRGMFMSSTLESSVLMGKNYSDNCHSIANTTDLTMKQMFNISEKLLTEQSDEICGVNTINWDDSSWKHLSLIGDEEVVSLSRARGLRIFRLCVLLWKDTRGPSIKHCMGTKIGVVQKYTGIQNLGQNTW